MHLVITGLPQTEPEPQGYNLKQVLKIDVYSRYLCFQYERYVIFDSHINPITEYWCNHAGKSSRFCTACSSSTSLFAITRSRGRSPSSTEALKWILKLSSEYWSSPLNTEALDRVLKLSIEYWSSRLNTEALNWILKLSIEYWNSPFHKVATFPSFMWSAVEERRQILDGVVSPVYDTRL